MELDVNEFKEVILEEFPKLRDGGWYMLFKCTPNTRTLEPLSETVLSSPKVLKERVGTSRTYIRHLQQDLDLSQVLQLPKGVSLCQPCYLSQRWIYVASRIVLWMWNGWGPSHSFVELWKKVIHYNCNFKDFCTHFPEQTKVIIQNLMTLMKYVTFLRVLSSNNFYLCFLCGFQFPPDEFTTHLETCGKYVTFQIDNCVHLSRERKPSGQKSQVMVDLTCDSDVEAEGAGICKMSPFHVSQWPPLQTLSKKWWTQSFNEACRLDLHLSLSCDW